MRGPGGARVRPNAVRARTFAESYQERGTFAAVPAAPFALCLAGRAAITFFLPPVVSFRAASMIAYSIVTVPGRVQLARDRADIEAAKASYAR